ncbi:SMI1/KNR4 family protein [Fusobacterium hwasookii]
MTLIIEKINKIEKLYHTEGCSFKQIKEAQQELGITFPDEYIDIIKKYGTISFYGTEWTGLNVEGYLNVVSTTKQEREMNSAFPLDCFVLENQGIDGLIIICNEKGEVFSIQYSKIEKIYSSISDYLDECIKRKK